MAGDLEVWILMSVGAVRGSSPPVFGPLLTNLGLC
jgi:hypothetical protein